MRGRPRHQVGRVFAEGNYWAGEYRQPLAQPDGTIKRVHRYANLGLRSEFRLTDAKHELAGIIAQKTAVTPDGRISLEWFVRNRWFPLKFAKWKESTRGTNVGIVQNQILRDLGSYPIEQLDRFKLQSHLNMLASNGKNGESLSYSIIRHTHSFLREMFLDAEDMGFVDRSPAGRLTIPRVETPWTVSSDNLDGSRPFLTIEQLHKLLSVLPNVHKPDRVIVMLCSLCAMRIGEVLGLMWSCFENESLQIVQRV